MKTTFHLVLSLLFFIVLMGCKNDDPEKEPKDPEILYLQCPYTPIKAEMDSIVGYWKLAKHFFRAETSEPMDSADYSCSNTIYHFRKDGILEITSEDPYIQGTYIYKYKPVKGDPLALPGPNLEISPNPEITDKPAPDFGIMEGSFFGIAYPSSLSITEVDHKDFKRLIRLKK